MNINLYFENNKKKKLNSLVLLFLCSLFLIVINLKPFFQNYPIDRVILLINLIGYLTIVLFIKILISHYQIYLE